MSSRTYGSLRVLTKSEIFQREWHEFTNCTKNFRFANLLIRNIRVPKELICQPTLLKL
jgi:hypothetical protein